MRALFIGLCALALAAGCSEEDSDTPAPSCACEGDQCLEGVCTLRVVINDACWGNAKVFVGDLSEEAEPVGFASEGSPLQLCEGFRAPDEMGQGAETFQFIVESEDGRSILGTLGGDSVSCAGSNVFVFNADSCQ